MRTGLIVIALGIALLKFSTPTFAGNWSVGSGLFYSSGNYGYDTRTDVFYLPVNLSWQNYPLKFSVASGAASISGPGNVYSDSTTTVTSTVPDFGRADTYVAISRYWNIGVIDIFDFMEWEAKIKLPTANAQKRLGTGMPDAQLQTRLLKKLGPGYGITKLAYRWRGDPVPIDLLNTVNIRLAWSQKVSRQHTFGLELQFQTRSTTVAAPRGEISASAGYRFTKAWQLSTLFSKGLLAGSANYAGGFELKHFF
ncbi:MAG: hypothetical protein OEZ43_16620 [Gammaproteobacteria bacterium]|nr:hypothetical protein [Gammaproteobacteria bacterium]